MNIVLIQYIHRTILFFVAAWIDGYICSDTLISRDCEGITDYLGLSFDEEVVVNRTMRDAWASFDADLSGKTFRYTFTGAA